MIEGTGECYFQSESHVISFIKSLIFPSAEEGLDPHCLMAIYVKNEDLTPPFFSNSKKKYRPCLQVDH